LIKLPCIIGHRGSAGTAPENTLEGFRAAADAGIRWVEFDVRLSADRVPVVIHDPTLKRTVGIEAQVDKTSAAELARLSRAFGVPTLYETMSLLGELGLGANVEIKPLRAKRTVATAVAQVLEDARRDLSVPVLVSSFAPPILEEMQRAVDDLPRGILLPRGTHDPIGLARRLGCESIHEDHRRLTRRRVADWGEAGYAVVCYTVNDSSRARELLDWGVDSIISDFPGMLANDVDPSGKNEERQRNC
jgi:glycerophosphoryl diester phosphodiesterase